MRYVLVDANHLARRCQYAVPDPRTGTGVGVVYGFLRAMLHAQNQCVVFPNAIIAVWDNGVSPERREIIPEYKTPFRPKELNEREKDYERQAFDQMEALHAMLPDFGIRSIKEPGFEADDVIAFAVDELVEAGHRAVIYTGDKDFQQMVNEKVLVFDTRDNGRMMTEEAVCKSWRVKPPLNENLLKLRSLSGDKSDSIKGVHGIGAKKAVQLLPYWDFLWNDDPVVATKPIQNLIKLAREQREDIEKAWKCARLPTTLFSQEKEDGIRQRVKEIIFSPDPDRDHVKMAQHLQDWGIMAL